MGDRLTVRAVQAMTESAEVGAEFRRRSSLCERFRSLVNTSVTEQASPEHCRLPFSLFCSLLKSG